MISLSRLPSGDIEVRPVARLNGKWAAFQGVIKGHAGRNRKLATGEWQTTIPAANLTKVISALEGAGLPVECDEGVKVLLSAKVAELQSLEASLDGELEAAEEHAGASLYPFQAAGVLWLRQQAAGLLGDEMGLGKTVQALLAHPANRGMLVICPASLKGNWAAEADRWRPDLDVTVLEGWMSFRWPRRGELVITNYDVLPPTLEEWTQALPIVEAIVNLFLKVRYIGPAIYQEMPHSPIDSHLENRTTIVADEAHALMNFKAQRTKRFRALHTLCTEAGGRTWLLTGTPLLNRPTELWTVLGAAGLEKLAFGTWKQFCECFNAYQQRIPGRAERYHWVFGSPNGTVEERLRAVMFRRRRADVLPDLPTKTWRQIETTPIAATLNRKLDALQKEIEESGIWTEDDDGDLPMPGFTGFSEAREALAKSKIATMLDFVEQYEEQGEPLVVFSAHRRPIDEFAGREGWGVITGDTSAADRTALVAAFQAGQLRGIAGTIQAMGVGVTLTRAAHMLVVDQAWTPALNAQAEDRLVRIGQTRGVVITQLVAPHPLDRHVTKLLNAKRTIIGATVEAASGERKVSLGEVAARVSKAPGARVSEERKNWTAKSELETWITSAIRQLCNDDPDRAVEENGVGFNKFDGPFGHSLESKFSRGLSVKQWKAAYRLCVKYKRQVGFPPEGARCGVCSSWHVGGCEE